VLKKQNSLSAAACHCVMQLVFFSGEITGAAKDAVCSDTVNVEDTVWCSGAERRVVWDTSSEFH